jgi:peptide/nickel transport system substrate-binding protein
MQQAGGAARTSAVGSGPFKIAAYVPGSHVRYVKHREYWEQNLPYLDEVRLQFMPDEAQRIEALRTGRARYAPVGPAAAQQLKRELTVLSTPGPTQIVTAFNTRRKPFDDVRVRQAISLVVERQPAIERVLGGAGQLTGPVPTGHGDWAIPPESLPYRKDLATAKHLLSEAGLADGFEATIKTTSAYPALLGTANLLADQVKPLDITLKIEQVEPSALVKALDARDFELISHRISFLPDPDAYLTPHTSRGLSNSPSLTSWSNARYDELVEQARTTMDPGARKTLYDEAAGIVMHEAPMLWWCTENTIEALHPSIKGYRQSFTGRRIGLKKAWLDGPIP